MKRFILCALCLLLPVGGMQAQGDFNPPDPAEPQTPVFYYPLTVTCMPVEAAYTSGRGTYAPGTSVRVSTSPRSGYVFSHWELNGQRYETTATTIQYGTTAGRMDFVAVFDFLPDDPDEPVMNVKSRLYLTSEPAGVCTFNRTSGDWVTALQPMAIDVTGVDQLYAFDGWYQGDTKLSDEEAFSYTPPYNDVTLTAHFHEVPFVPFNPDEPGETLPVSYRLTYVVDGAEFRSAFLEYGASIPTVPEPTKEGYTFSGWSEVPETMPDHDITVTGSFCVNQYKVTFVADGQTVREDVLDFGAAIVVPEAPMKEGYTFKTWGEVAATVPMGDVTYTAEYVINQYTVTYYVNNEVWAADTYDYGAAVTLRIYEPSDSRYTFLAWEEEAVETMPARDLDFHATLADGIGEVSNRAGPAVDVYSLAGVKLLTGASLGAIKARLPRGVYIAGGRKMILE